MLRASGSVLGWTELSMEQQSGQTGKWESFSSELYLCQTLPPTSNITKVGAGNFLCVF